MHKNIWIIGWKLEIQTFIIPFNVFQFLFLISTTTYGFLGVMALITQEKVVEMYNDNNNSLHYTLSHHKSQNCVFYCPRRHWRAGWCYLTFCESVTPSLKLTAQNASHPFLFQPEMKAIKLYLRINGRVFYVVKNTVCKSYTKSNLTQHMTEPPTPFFRIRQICFWTPSFPSTLMTTLVPETSWSSQKSRHKEADSSVVQFVSLLLSTVSYC